MTTDTGDIQVDTSDVLTWLTGSKTEPPMGFNSNITLRFDEGLSHPRVSVCAMELMLPLVERYRDFVSVVSLYTQLVIDSQGFGLDSL